MHAALPVDEQDEGHHRQPGETDPEAELLNPRVALHTQRDHDRDEGQEDEAGDEEPGSGRVRSAQEGGPVLAADGGADVCVLRALSTGRTAVALIRGAHPGVHRRRVERDGRART